MRVLNFFKLLTLFSIAALQINTVFAKNDTDIPAKWASEAAIVTNQESDFFYIPVNKGKEISVVHNERFNVVINNESGAKEFKFVYLPKSYSVEVSVEGENRSDDYNQGDAKETKFGEEVPYFFAQLFKNYTEFEKINLGALEKGDEINVSYSMESLIEEKEFLGDLDCRAFDYQAITFPTVFPKGNHVVTVKLGGEMYFNFGAQNGGPSAGIESRLEADTTIYVIEEGQTDAIARQYFSYPARIYPTSKFEVAVCPSYKADDATMILGTIGASNETWEQTQMKTVIYNKVDEWSNYSNIAKDLSEFLAEVRIKGTDDLLLQYYKGFQSFVYNTGKLEDAVYSPAMFMGVMIEIFNDNEIAFDIIGGPDRRTASLDDMILNGEMVYGFRVKDSREEYFYFPFTKYSTWTDKKVALLGQEAFSLSPAKKLEESVFDVLEMPESLPAENQKVIREKVKLGDGFTAVIANKNTSYKGNFKEEMAPYILTVPEYHKAMLDRRVYADYADLRDEDAAEELKENRLKFFEADVRSDMDTVEFQRFNVKSTGFEEDEEWLQINEKFTVPGDNAVRFEIKDSMRVYTVALGKFIDTDYKISASTFSREGDIYVDYPRIVDYTVRFEIPSGYAVFGFADFETDLKTDFASYTCTAKIEPGELKVSATLVIKEAYLNENEWEQLASILNKFEETAKVKITLAGN